MPIFNESFIKKRGLWSCEQCTRAIETPKKREKKNACIRVSERKLIGFLKQARFEHKFPI